MKLLCVSDLHIGKRVKGYSLIEDQNFILQQILSTAKKEKVKGLVIAGDIYDTSIPTIEAVTLFDKFISSLFKEKISCYAVSGNHDSISRVTFGSEILAEGEIYFAKKYDGKLSPVKIDKNINIWLLPFIRPTDVRCFHPDFKIGSYEEMMQQVIKNCNIDTSKTNILVAHQFIMSSGKKPEISDSETVSLGTLDSIDASVFDDFDYVALGHLHRPQEIGRKEVRYCGSPLKYSFSEKNDNKSMVLLDIQNKNINIKFVPYKAKKDMREFVGTYEELKKLNPTEDYARIVLKDETYINDIKHKLESVFPNVMEIIYDNTYTQKREEVELIENIKEQSPLDLFKNFYLMQNNKEMSKEQINIIKDIFEELNLEETV